MCCSALQALEALRKLRSEKAAEAKEFKLKLDHLKTHKDNAQKLRSEIQEGEDKEREFNEQIQTLEEQLQVWRLCQGHMHVQIIASSMLAVAASASTVHIRFPARSPLT